MIKSEWLKEYKRLCQEIKYLKWNINKIESQLNRSGIRALLHETIETESETELQKRLNQMQEQLDEKERLHCFYTEVFNSIEDETDKEIVRMLIDGQNLKSIADHLCFCERYIMIKNGNLSKSIQFLVDCRL